MTVDQCLDFNSLETEVLIIQKLEDENSEENPTVDFIWSDKLDNNDANQHFVKTEQVV